MNYWLCALWRKQIVNVPFTCKLIIYFIIDGYSTLTSEFMYSEFRTPELTSDIFDEHKTLGSHRITVLVVRDLFSFSYFSRTERHVFFWAKDIRRKFRHQHTLLYELLSIIKLIYDLWFALKPMLVCSYWKIEHWFKLPLYTITNLKLIHINL